MPDSQSLALVVLVLGALLLGGGGLGLSRSGSNLSVARRLAAARQLRLADLLAAERLPSRPVRVVGRIRCADPIVTAVGDRLVALHRDVDVHTAQGGWRTIERLRESRAFELWDHAGSVPIDPAAAAEPLVVIPHVWRGGVDELGEEHRAAVARVAGEAGKPDAARSVTRMLSVIERLLVLAVPRRAGGGGLALEPPPGGYIISALELDDAMRLLGGARRRLLIGGAVALGLGALLILAGVALLATGALIGG